MLDRNQTVADLVIDHSECASVFKRHRIDFCCRGDVSLEDACARAGVDATALIDELTEAIAAREGRRRRSDPRLMSTAALIDYIVEKHHAYLRRALPFVRELAQKVARVHGDREESLRRLDGIVAELGDSLLAHIDDEEEVLFPALTGEGEREHIERELATMNDEHFAVGLLLASLRDVTNDFSAPDWACNSYRTLFSELEELEGDVLEHVHLENHVLMPRFASRPRS